MTIGHDCHASSRWTMSEAMMLVVLVEIPDGDRPSAGKTPLHSKAFDVWTNSTWLLAFVALGELTIWSLAVSVPLEQFAVIAHALGRRLFPADEGWCLMPAWRRHRKQAAGFGRPLQEC